MSVDNKIYKDCKEARESEIKFENTSNAFIQWKSTDAFMNIACKCGAVTSVGGCFLYKVKCCECGRNYAVGSHIELFEIEETANKNGDVVETW